MREMTVINDVLFVFVLCFQVIEAFLSYSATVYGKKEIKSKLMIWLIIHLGYLWTFIVTRGIVISLYALFIYLCGGCIKALWVSTLLLVFYICKITCGKSH